MLKMIIKFLRKTEKKSLLLLLIKKILTLRKMHLELDYLQKKVVLIQIKYNKFYAIN